MIDLSDVDFFYFNIGFLIFVVPFVIVVNILFEIASDFFLESKGRG